MEVDKIKVEVKEEPNDEIGDTLAMLADPPPAELVVFKIEEINTEESVAVNQEHSSSGILNEIESLAIPGTSKKGMSLIFFLSLMNNISCFAMLKRISLFSVCDTKREMLYNYIKPFPITKLVHRQTLNTAVSEKSAIMWFFAVFVSFERLYLGNYDRFFKSVR